MKTLRPGAVRYPRVYQVFKSAEEIGEVINRSRAYVNKALKNGFTDREKRIIIAHTGRQDIFEEGAA